MANEAVAIAWLLSHSNEYQLKIETMSWIDKAFPGWTDVHCALAIKGNELSSWGASESPDIALLKAFAEATEREVLHHSGRPTSNGFAAHISPSKARRNAMYELIERDLFLCHFLTKTPFSPFPKKLKKNWKWLFQIKKLIRDLDLRIRYYMLGNSGLVCAIDGLESNNAIGFIFGASYKENLEEAAISATIESLRQAYFIRISNNTNNLSLEQFLLIEKPNFKDHGDLAINLDYAHQIAALFSNKEKSSNGYPYKELGLGDLSVIELPWITDDCPFYFAKADSPNAQNLFLGAPKESDVNLKRLQDFAGKPITLLDVNPLPHPFN